MSAPLHKACAYLNISRPHTSTHIADIKMRRHASAAASLRHADGAGCHRPPTAFMSPTNIASPSSRCLKANTPLRRRHAIMRAEAAAFRLFRALHASSRRRVVWRKRKKLFSRRQARRAMLFCAPITHDATIPPSSPPATLRERASKYRDALFAFCRYAAGFYSRADAIAMPSIFRRVSTRA